MSTRYEVEFTKRSLNELEALDKRDRNYVRAAIDLLKDNPRPPKMTRLAGRPGACRVRAGDYRIIYEIEASRLTVLVIRVGNRREVYDR